MALRQIMRKVSIIRQIDLTVFKRRGPIDHWHIGITDRPNEIRESLSSDGRDLSRWTEWKANTVAEAQAIGRLFVMLGMKDEGTEATAQAETVYVF